MEKETSTAGKKTFFRKVKRKPLVIIALCIILLAAVAVPLIIRFNSSAVKNTVVQRTARVARGNIVNTVTGSGSVESSNTSNVSSSVSGKITKIYYEEGDSVKAGDLLFEIDDSDAQLDVQKIKNSISQTLLSAEKNSKSLKNLYITAPFDGQVTNIIPEVGDELTKGTNVLTITDYSKLKLTVAFSEAAVKEIYIGQKVTVNIEDLMYSVEGTVSYISSSPTVTTSNGAAYNVEVTIDNPGSLKDGMNANVEVQVNGRSQMSTNSGKLEYANSQTISCESSGTVESINVREDQFVRAGQLLIKLESDDLKVSSQTTSLNLEELYSQLEAKEKQLDDYKIYAPIDGVITSQNVKEGDKVKEGDVLATIIDPVHMEFSIPIDELDIAKIQVGQEVNITVEALEETTEKPLSGTVTKIALEGNPSNGVTTYPVTVQINETSNLKIGMNADAEIIVNEKNNILLIPLEAVQKVGDNYFVFVKRGTGELNVPNMNFDTKMNGGPGDKMPQGAPDGKTNRPAGNISNAPAGKAQDIPADNADKEDSKQEDKMQKQTARETKGRSSAKMPGSNSGYYENAVLTPVELGINNDEYIEVISGLQEGDEIILPALSTSTSTTNTTNMNGMPMGGGMFGGMGAPFGGGGMRNEGPRGGGQGGQAPSGPRN